jgi:hypothetical protein
MRSVYLDYTSNTNEYYVTEEDYRNVILPMVMKLRVCATCHQYYDPENNRACVGLRICIRCFLIKHSHLRFLEVKSVDDDGEVTYAFIDAEGNVYTSRENYSDSPSKDISYTLAQHSFTLPERYKPFKATEEIRLHTSHFTIYGDLQTASVLVADYNDYYDKHHCAFLLYKNGGYKELTKRGEGRVLIERATAMLERTKLPNGYYKIDGHEVYRISDGDIYKIVSQMETAMYNISMQFGLPIQQEQPETEAEEIKEPQVEEERPRRPRLSVVPSQETTSDEETQANTAEEVQTEEAAELVEPITVDEAPTQEDDQPSTGSRGGNE